MHWGYDKDKFELKNAKLKKTSLLSYKSIYWLMNKYTIKTYQWITETPEKYCDCKWMWPISLFRN